jgi:flagellar FliJ protein
VKQFTLAGLLRVRSLEEREAAASLAQANQRINSIRSQRERTIAALAGTSVEATGANNLAALAASRAAAQTQLSELAALHELASAEARQATDEHRAARARLLALEKLHDRHTTAVHVEELQVEQNALDEIAVGSWRRKERTAR